MYIPYRFVSDTTKMHKFMVVNAEDYIPELTMKVEAEYSNRELLMFYTAYGENAVDNNLSGLNLYSLINNKGGTLPMQGINTNPMEFMLDFGHFYKDEEFYQENDFGKIFLRVFDNDEDNMYSGQIYAFSIVDYRWGEEFELGCEANFPVNINNYNYTDLFVNYDLVVPGDNQIISQNTNLTSDMVCRFTPTVPDHTTLTVKNGVEIDMYDSELIIEPGSSLVIENNATIHAKRGENKITVNGNIQFGSNVSFVAEPGASLEIYFNNIGASISLNSCTLENVKLTSFANSLTINNNSTINNSLIYHNNGYFTLDNSSLTSSTVKCTDTDLTGINVQASITGNTFNQGYDMENFVVSITGYPNYVFDNNAIINRIITVGTFYGLFVGNSGGSTRNEHSISNNEIYSQETCMSLQCPAIPIGMGIYNSYATLTKNNVYHNYLGVECLNNTQITMVGESTATYVNETQRFINNYSQMYVSQYGFPSSFIYNAIFNYDYSNKILINHAVPNILPMVNVTNNYWGTNFDPAQNLYPAGHYNYLPIWNLQEGGNLAQSAASLLFEAGLEQVADSNYTGAKNTFKEVVTEYPAEEPATSALKELLYLEPIADNDFLSLKTWYLTEEVIQENENLLKLAGNLAVKCDEKLENYQDAIDWYENEIENPPSLEDSVFAIIDLEHVYLLMGIDTNLRSTAYVGRLMQFRPESLKTHEQHRNELLALLLGLENQDANNEELFNENYKLNSGQLLQNIPNPFSTTTTIQFNLNSKEFSSVEIRIHDQIGKEVQHIPVKSPIEGMNKVELNMQGFPAGMYYCSLYVNGNLVDSKKMVVGR